MASTQLVVKVYDRSLFTTENMADGEDLQTAISEDYRPQVQHCAWSQKDQAKLGSVESNWYHLEVFLIFSAVLAVFCAIRIAIYLCISLRPLGLFNLPRRIRRGVLKIFIDTFYLECDFLVDEKKVGRAAISEFSEEASLLLSDTGIRLFNNSSD